MPALPEATSVLEMKQKLRNSWLTDSPNADYWQLTDEERASLIEEMSRLRAVATEWSEDALWVPLELDGQICDVIDHLVAGDYEWLIRSGRLDPDPSRLEGLRDELEGYPATFVSLPPEAFLIAHYWESSVEDEVGLVEAPLWSAEEGPSDLETRLIVRPSGRVQLYDLLVP